MENVLAAAGADSVIAVMNAAPRRARLLSMEGSRKVRFNRFLSTDETSSLTKSSGKRLTSALRVSTCPTRCRRPSLVEEPLQRVDRALDAALAQQIDIREEALCDAGNDRVGDDRRDLARGEAVLALADVAKLDVRQVEVYPLALEQRRGHRDFRAADEEPVDDEAPFRSLHARGAVRIARALRVRLDVLRDHVEVGGLVAALVDDRGRVDADSAHVDDGLAQRGRIDLEDHVAEASAARRAKSRRIADLEGAKPPD